MCEGDELALIWPQRPGAVEHKLIVWRPATEDHLTRERLRGRALLPGGAVDVTSDRWRVEARDAADAPWQEWVPYVEFDVPAARSATTVELRWKRDGSAAYRVLVRRARDGVQVHWRATVARSMVVDLAALDPEPLEWSVQPALGGGWAAPRPWRPLALDTRPAGGAPPAAAPAPAWTPPGLVVVVLCCDLAVDPRHAPSPEAALTAQVVGGGAGGLGLVGVLDRLEHHGARGTIFLDALASRTVGDAPLRRVAREVQARGHEVELLLHPAAHLSGDPSHHDLAGALEDEPDAGRLAALVDLALEDFGRVVGRVARAVRAAGRDASRPLLDVLAARGVMIDASIHPLHGRHRLGWLRARTQPFAYGEHGGICVVPTTVLARRGAGGLVAEALDPATRAAEHGSLLRAVHPAPGTAIVLSYDIATGTLAGDGADDRRRAASLDGFLASIAARGDVQTPGIASVLELPGAGGEVLVIGEPAGGRPSRLARWTAARLVDAERMAS